MGLKGNQITLELNWVNVEAWRAVAVAVQCGCSDSSCLLKNIVFSLTAEGETTERERTKSQETVQRSGDTVQICIG